jgi:hypothetical protein
MEYSVGNSTPETKHKYYIHFLGGMPTSYDVIVWLKRLCHKNWLFGFFNKKKYKKKNKFIKMLNLNPEAWTKPPQFI